MLSRAEHRLTYTTRRFLAKWFTPTQIRVGSFALALATCLVDASVATFSLYTASFTEKLNYSTLDNNIVSASMLAGLYGTLPLLGYLSDVHGPVLLSITGALITPGYLLAYSTFINDLPLPVMAFAFFLIGTGTSSAYFCSLLTCAKIFPHSKGLGISLPVTCYGISALILAYFQTGYATETVFFTFAILYAVVAVINWVSSIVVTIEKEVLFKQNYGAINDNEEDDDEPVKSRAPPLRALLADKRAHLLFASLFLVAGPLEVYIANLATLTVSPTTAVAVFAVASTIGRLLVGILGDLTTVSALALVLTATTLAAAALAVPAPAPPAATALLGTAYGAIFTAYPALVAHTWGVDALGTVWGVFLAAPAIGGAVWGVVFALDGGKLMCLAAWLGVVAVGAGGRE